MADNDKKVALQLAISTTGAEQVGALAAQFDALAKQGGELAPEFEALAAQLREIGQQDALVNEFKQVGEAIAITTTQIEAAKIASDSLGTSYQEQAVRVEAFRDQQALLQQGIGQLDAGLAEARGNLQLLQANTDAAGKSTDGYKATVASLRQEIADQNVALGQQKSALADVTAEANSAQQSLDKLGVQYNQASAAVDALGGQLTTQKDALAGVTTSLDALGVSTVSVAEAQAQVAVAMSDVRASAGSLLIDYDELTEAQLRAVAAAEADVKAQEDLNFEMQTQHALYTSLFEEVVARATAANDLATALKAETEAQQKATLAAEEAISGAFGVLGVRSMEEIQASVAAVEQSLVVLADGYERGVVSAESFTRATAAAQVELAALVEESRTLPELPTMFDNIKSSVNGVVSEFAGLAASIGIFTLAVKPVIDLAIQVDSLNRALTTITGSATEAAAQMAFLSQTANLSGLSVSSLSDSFVQFTASVRTAGFSAADTQQIFASVANAAGNLGLSTDKASSILLAIGQIANKGVVSMEELRRQLGEALPGALNLLSQGLGITQAQLIKLVESGQLTAQQALIPLANALTQLGTKGKDVEGLSASFARLENAGRDALKAITDSSAFKLLGESVDFVTQHFAALTEGVKLLGEAFVIGKIGDAISNFAQLGATTITTTAAIAANSVVEVENTTVTQANTTARIASTEAAIAAAAANVELSATTSAISTTGLAAGRAISALSEAPSLLAKVGSSALALVGGPVGAITLFALNARAIGTAIAETVAHLDGFDAEMKKEQQALADSATSAKLNQQAHQQLAAQIVQGNVAYQEQALVLAAQIVASTKLVDAKKLEGEALVNIATLSGSESQARAAAVAATQNNEAAVQALVDARQKEVTNLSDHIDKVTSDAAATGTLDVALQKQIDTQKLQLTTQQASLAQAQAQLANSHSLTLAATAASTAYQDNANKLETLKAAFEATSTAAALNKQANVDGVVSIEAVTRSAQAAALAQNAYRDAINDQIAAAGRQVAGASLYERTVGQTSQSTALAAAAATNYANKIDLLSSSLQAQVAALRVSQAAVTAEIAAHGDPGGVRAKELADIQSKIDLTTAEVVKTDEAAQSSKDEAAAKELAAQAYKDNSGRVAEYMQAMDIANASLRKQIDLQKEGKASSDDVSAALRAAAQAQALYKDAVDDTIKNMQAQQTLNTSLNTQLDANIKLAQAQASAQEAAARATGDEAGATQAAIAGKQAEISLRAQTAEQMRQEADAAIALAKAQEAEEQQLGTLTPAKKLEYDARINNANAEKTEADAEAAAIPGIEAEISALQKLTAATGANTAATTKTASATTSGTGADRTNGGAATNSAPTDIAFAIQTKLQKGTLTADDLANAQTAVQQATTASQLESYFKREGFADIGSNGSGALLNNANAALLQVQGIIAQQAKASAAGSTSTSNVPGAVGNTPAAATPAASTASTTHNVNITLNGSTTSINAASASDAANLSNLLQQIGAASLRSTAS